MKYLILFLVYMSSAQAQTETVITSHGTYVVNWAQGTSTVYTSAAPAVALALTQPRTNPVTGVGQVITPKGTYMVSRQGSTTTLIQVSKGK